MAKHSMKEGRAFFSEKKNQKTSPRDAHGTADARPQKDGVFLLLFLQKKKTLPFIV
jgi:hypothetical protein